MAKSKPHKISQEDFDSWRDNPITQAVFAHFSATGEKIKEEWVGFLLGPVPYETTEWQLRHADARAKLWMIAELGNLELSDIQEEEDDGDTGKRRA